MNPVSRSRLMSLTLAMVFAWPWSIALAEMESAGEAIEAVATSGPVRALRLPRSERNHVPAALTMRIAESDDEDGDGPGRIFLSFTDVDGPALVGPIVATGTSWVVSPAPARSRLFQSQRLRC